MPKHILLVLTVLFGLLCSTVYGTSIAIQSPIPAICKQDQYLTPAGCWSSCSGSKYSTCGDIFPALYNPSFCGYTNDGRYVSYTYECQACKSTGIVAVRSGACDCSVIGCGFAQKCLEGECVNIPFDPIDLCFNVVCPKKFVCQNGKCIQQVRVCSQSCIYGYKCKNGICIPDLSLDKCALIRCMEGYTCKNSTCIKNSVCLANQYETPSGCWSSCSSSQFSTCADFYPLLYNPSYCAYTTEGKYVSYTFSCQACKNTGVVAVRNGACDCSFIKCGLKEQCLNGQCVPLQPVDPVDPCWLMKCSIGYTCQSGKCVVLHPIDPIDPCWLIKCSIGFVCQSGKCVAEVKPCTKLCIFGYICVNGQCVPDVTIDKCSYIKCIQGYTCVQGTCVPNIDWSCALIRCAPGYICIKGKCVSVIPDLCQNVLCPKGSICKLGVCIPDLISIDLCSFIKCPVNTTCQNGICSPIDRCATIRCMQGYYCLNGNCYPQVGLCGIVVCAPGYVCINGKCTQLIDPCSYIKCAAGSICQLGQCVPQIDLCAIVKCSVGYTCQNGICVKDTLQLCDAQRYACTDPRPNEKTCPTRYYFVAPTSNFCGITSEGNQLGFPEECDACKDTTVQYYWNKPCDQIKPCLSDSVCSYDWQCQSGLSCDNKKCVNKCLYVKCWAGAHCSYGRCVSDLAIQTTVSVKTQIADLCASVSCLTNTKCIAGECISLDIIAKI